MDADITPRRRGPYAKTRARRRELASATLDLVIERGHLAVSMADVAERAGISEPTVLYHFPTKDDLFVAALEERDRREVEGGLVYSYDNLEFMFREITAEGIQHPHSRRLFAVMAAAATDPSHPAHAYMLQRQRRVAQELGEMLSGLQETGRAHPDIDPARFGRQMVAIWDGLQLQWVTNPDFDLTDEVVAAFRALAWQAAMDAKRAIEALAAGI